MILTLHGDAAGDEFGTSIAGLGDVDGDGFDDLFVGAPYSDVAFPEAGLARVHSGRDGSVLWTATGSTPDARLGTSVASVADVDSDGVREAAVGAPGGEILLGLAGGVVSVLSGIDGQLIVSDGDLLEIGAGFGTSIAVDDVTGDGIEDVIVGAPDSDFAAPDAGYVRTVLINPAAFPFRVDGATAGARLGASVASVGDVTGDGVAEIVAGAPGEDTVHVLEWGPSPFVTSISGAVPGERYGIAVGSAGDVNGDGVRDLIVGADRAEAPVAGLTVDEGRFEVLSGATFQPLFERYGATRFEQLGFSVAGVGDVDGDGFDDVAAGAPGLRTGTNAFNVGLALVVGGSDRLGTPYCPGANNSLAVPAVLSGRGSALVSANDVELTVTGLPTNTTGFFIASQTQGLVVSPAGSTGTLCLGGDIGRFVGPGQLQNSGAAGEFFLAPDVMSLPTPTGTTAATAGQTWNFQAWYRDVIGGLGIATSNFTNGLEITFG